MFQIFHGTCYAKSLQSCLTLCDPIDGSPPGSPVPGILQARTLEWVAIPFSCPPTKLSVLSLVLLERRFSYAGTKKDFRRALL